MASITKLPFLRHLRADASTTILQTKNGRLIRSGRGLTFLFFPFTSSIDEIPMDEQDLVLLFSGRSQDFPEVLREFGIVAMSPLSRRESWALRKPAESA